MREAGYGEARAGNDEDARAERRFVAGGLAHENPDDSPLDSGDILKQVGREISCVLVELSHEWPEMGRHGNGCQSITSYTTCGRLELSLIQTVSMAIRTAARIARRFLGSQLRTAVIAHVDPLGNSWGWFAGGVPRMHLEPLAPKHRGGARVWLKRRGRRCFELDHIEPGSKLDIGELRGSVRRSRDTIEGAWLQSSELRGWLAYSARDSMVSLYWGTPHQVVRRLPEPGQRPQLLQIDAQANAIRLELNANRIIWLGADDDSDVE